MRKALYVATGLAGLALAGCQGVGTISGENVQSFYDPSLVGYAARDGGLPLVAYGQPYAVGTDVARTLAGELTPPGDSGAARFVAASDTEVGEAGRVVLAFDGVQDGEVVCSKPGGQATHPVGGGKLRVLAVFCLGRHMVSEAQLMTLRPAGAGDDGFRGDMQVLLTRLLPQQTPSQNADCPPANRC